MKHNPRLIRRIKMFDETMAEEATKRAPLDIAPSVQYDRLYAKFARAMDAHDQHGPVRIIVANGKKVENANG